MLLRKRLCRDDVTIKLPSCRVVLRGLPGRGLSLMVPLWRYFVLSLDMALSLTRKCWATSLTIIPPVSMPIAIFTGPRSTVGNVSGYRCVSDCRSRGREFDPGQVPYFRGDWSWNNFYGHSPPFRWFIQEGLFSVTSESMCTNYWLTACSSLPRKKCG